MIDIFTSQHGEDKWIAENWHTLGLPDRGTFVEVGAADGRKLSNTFWLEWTKGWAGILVEPNPYQVINCRPKSIVERVAIGRGETGSLGLEDDPFLSGFKRTGKNRIDVPVMGLTELLKKHGVAQLDLISIDTEGTELDCWDTLDLTQFRPKVAIIEMYTWKIGDNSDAVHRRMTDDWYTLVHRTDHNGIFVPHDPRNPS